MADQQLQDVSGGELTVLAAGDLFLVLDGSDTTDDPDGTIKNIKSSTLGLLVPGVAKTASFTAEVGYIYPVSVTTAQIDVTFPSTPTAGDRFGYYVKLQSTTTGSFTQAPGKCIEPNNPTINAAVYAKETIGSNKWGLWLNGESLVFEYVDATLGWRIVADGRIQCVSNDEIDAVQTINNASLTKVDIDNAITDNFSLLDSTNKELEVKRAGEYGVAAATIYANSTSTSGIGADALRILTKVSLDGTGIGQAEMSGRSGGYPSPFFAKATTILAAAEVVTLHGFQDSGAQQGLYYSAGDSTSFLTIAEQL